MRISKEVVTRYQPGKAPVCGFMTYTSISQPVLTRRLGWETGDDVHEDFSDQISHDNGRTWSEPRPSMTSRKEGDSFVYYIEFAPLLHKGRSRFILATNEKRQHSLEDCDMLGHLKLHITVSDVDETGKIRPGTPLISNFGLPEAAVSFSNPIEDSKGRVLIPISWQKRDIDGSLQRVGIPLRPDRPDIAVDWGEVGLLIGEFDASGSIGWRVSQPVPMNIHASARGLYEGALAELSDGRLALVLRGSNNAQATCGGPDWTHLPSYKWVSFSEDGGETWSHAVPLPCDDGALLESSSTGSILFRSIKNEKLYWMGNLCLHGERANGNMPRSPLVLVEVQEEPFSLKRSTLTVIDQCAPHEDPETQHSNFKHYQDRETGDLVFLLTRYGERGSSDGRWMMADQYQYRVELT